MRNPIDALVGYFNPHEGLRRLRSREMLQRAYEGASKRDGWRPKRPGASANTDHAMDAATLRVRSRSLVQNVPYMAQGLRALVANVIGTGITPKWIGPQAARLDELWREWAPFADADGRLDVYGLQAAAYRAMEQDGEVLVRIRTRRPGDRLPVPVQFQLLEIDWLDSSKVGRNGGNTIVNGIEYNPIGQPVAYWLFDAHPGEQVSLSPRRTVSQPVAADRIIHLFTPERPGQGRGFPRAAPVIARVRDLQLYEDAELQRKNLETRLGVLASGDVAMLANAPADIAQLGSPEDARRTGDLGALPSGGITAVPDGVHLTTVQPQAAPGYVDYVKHQLHLIAAGWGVPYEMMTGDMAEVNFSSARIRAIDFRREAEMLQWTVVIPQFCQRLVDEFSDAASLAGLVPRARRRVEFSTPKWDYVNPQQEVRADLAEISGGLSSISEKLRRRGYDPEQVFQELADDVSRLRDLGLMDVLPIFQRPAQGAAATRGEPGNDAGRALK